MRAGLLLFNCVSLREPSYSCELRYLRALARARPGAVITTGQMDQQKCCSFPLQGNMVAAICKLIIKSDL